MSFFANRLGKIGAVLQNRAGGALTAAGLFLLAFLLGLHLFFPTAAARQWLTAEIAARTSAGVRLNELSLRPLFTFAAQRVEVTFDSPPRAPLVLDDLRVRPLWSSLLSGDPGIVIRTGLLQGRLDAVLRRGGDFDLRAAGLKLNSVPVHAETGTLLSGTLTRGELRGAFPAKRDGESRAALELEGGTLTVLGESLSLGKVVLEAGGQGNSLRITTLSASGGDIAVAGGGTLLLGATAAASRISLDLTLRPAPSAPPAFAALLDLAAPRQPDGGYRLRLNGSPGRLAIEQPAGAARPALPAAPAATPAAAETDDE